MLLYNSKKKLVLPSRTGLGMLSGVPGLGVGAPGGGGGGGATPPATVPGLLWSFTDPTNKFDAATGVWTSLEDDDIFMTWDGAAAALSVTASNRLKIAGNALEGVFEYSTAMELTGDGNPGLTFVVIAKSLTGSDDYTQFYLTSPTQTIRFRLQPHFSRSQAFLKYPGASQQSMNGSVNPLNAVVSFAASIAPTIARFRQNGTTATRTQSTSETESDAIGDNAYGSQNGFGYIGAGDTNVETEVLFSGLFDSDLTDTNWSDFRSDISDNALYGTEGITL